MQSKKSTCNTKWYGLFNRVDGGGGDLNLSSNVDLRCCNQDEKSFINLYSKIKLKEIVIFRQLLKKTGFTLAEVLITLGVIGVVAAITMPVLIQKYKEVQLSNQLKVTYSILSQGFSKMLSDESVTNFSETDLYAQLEADGFASSELEASFFQKYFNTVVFVSYDKQVAEGWPAGNADYTGDICSKFVGKGSTWWLKGKTKCRGLRQQVYRLANGSVIRSAFFHPTEINNEGKLKSIYAEITADVNGEKEPNTFGEDVFSFSVGQDGKVYPNFGLDYAHYYAAKFGTDYTTYYYNKGTKDSCKEGNGISCAGAVIEHNFDIHYYNK